MSFNIRYDKPARDLDLESIENWSLQLYSSLAENGSEGVEEEAHEIYQNVVEDDLDEEAAAYNLGIAASKAYENVNLARDEWNQRIIDGVMASAESNIRKVKDLLEYGIDDYNDLSIPDWNR